MFAGMLQITCIVFGYGVCGSGYFIEHVIMNGPDNLVLMVCTAQSFSDLKPTQWRYVYHDYSAIGFVISVGLFEFKFAV